MNLDQQRDDYRFVSSIIKFIAFGLAVMMLVVSNYSFLFFAIAMLPAVISIFADKESHGCSSSTITAFNLLGVFPYIVQVWPSQDMDYTIKLIMSELRTWIMIYGSAMLGIFFYWLIPYLVKKLYHAKNRVEISLLKSKRNSISADWRINVDNPLYEVNKFKDK